MPATLLPDAADRSLAENFALLPAGERESFLRSLTDNELQALEYDWQYWGRPKQQLPEGDWRTWLNLGGRGMGKTRTGAQAIRSWVEHSTEPLRIALVGQTSADVRDVMVQGESGILATSPPWARPEYVPARRSLIWHHNGCSALLFSGDTPDQLRGPQFHKAWVDELAKFQYPQETMDNLEFGLRLGPNPQTLVTTTPRPLPIIRQMLEDPMTRVTRGSSFENIANLPQSYIQRVIQKYEGTRIGRQELYAEVLMDMPGALWTYELVESMRVRELPELRRIVVAIDPAVTAHEDSDETGIIVCGRSADGLGYVLRDASGRYSAEGWAAKAIELYEAFDADRIVAEVNNGGDLVETVLRSKNRNVAYKAVRASHGKTRRAEPIAALCERGKVKLHGQFPVLEDQLCTYAPDQLQTSAERRRAAVLSPDRLDAFVWGMTELLLGKGGVFVV